MPLVLTDTEITGAVLDLSIDNGITSKWGLDGTRPLKEDEKYKRIAPPEGAMNKVKELLNL